MNLRTRSRLLAVGATAMGISALIAAGASSAGAHQSPWGPQGPAGHQSPWGQTTTIHQATTPIKHVVVIYGENISFDHYFGTYPNATNPAGETPFKAKRHTPEVNGLVADAANGYQNLLTDNPNGAQPQRLDPKSDSQVLTCDQNHGYTAEQKAFDGGKMDAFLANVGNGAGSSPTGAACQASDDMNYYDGNTVTAMWNYAQNYAMDDESFSTTFGPSTPGAINVISGDTGNVSTLVGSVLGNSVVSDGFGAYSDISDTAPYYDDCPDYTNQSIALTGENIGDQLNKAGISWGWFEGGFAPTTAYNGPVDDPGYVSPTTGSYESGDTAAACASTHNVGTAIGGTGATGAKPYGTKSDYIAHHEPFQYYASTANPHHLAPTSLSAVGTDTQSYVGGKPQFNTANHQYDMSVFNDLIAAIDNRQLSPDHLPAVSYLKAPGYEDGHAAYSDPLDEQKFVTDEINLIQQSPDWSSTAIILAYDDSDGWYDHVDAATLNHGQPQNASHSSADALNDAGDCGVGSATPVLTSTGGQPEQGRCGYGPRQPLLVISPWAKSNYVDNQVTDQSSVVKFIEDNWKLGQIPGSAANIAGSLDPMFDFNGGWGGNPHHLFLGSTGQPLSSQPTPPAPVSPSKTDMPVTQVTAASASGGLAWWTLVLIGIGGIAAGGGAWWTGRRRRQPDNPGAAA